MSDFIEVHRVYRTGGEAETYLLNCNQIRWVEREKDGCRIAVFTPDTMFGRIKVTESYEEIRRALWGG